MRVFGTVKDSITEAAIKGAKVRLSIGEKELAILYTDSDGKFEHSSPESYTGEILTFYAEKKGYKSQSSTYEIEGEEVPFDIELVPIVVDSLWKKLKRWFVKNKKWVAIGAGIVVFAVILYIIFIPDNVEGPDLVISKIEVSPATPVVNNKVTFKVRVKNKGNVKAGPSKLSFKVGGESRPPITKVPALSPGQEYIHTRIDTLTVAQNYLATAIADVEKDIDESNENNNVGTKSFRVIKLEVAKTDLIISNIEISPASPTVNELITFKVHVKNIGSATVSSSKLRFRVDGQNNTPINVIYTIPSLSSGQEYTQPRGDRLSVGQSYKLTATADYDDKVKESNENNNVRTRAFRVVTPYVSSSGSVMIHGTYSCDLDLGRETQTDADFFWQQATSTIRYITPRNGAKFRVLGVRDFNSITYSYLRSLSYSTQQIDGSNTSSNKIPERTVVAAITSKGRYCKFRIDTYGYNLTISWVTYSVR
jgi:hypothetical protein